jgi:serine/threonine-protein phosphatase 6 regulatory ankyrin repeat subunit B
MKSFFSLLAFSMLCLLIATEGFSQDKAYYSLINHYAKNGPVDSVEALINKGVSVSIRDHHGLTPIANACIASKPKIVDLLLTAGANPNTLTHSKMSLLMISAQERDTSSLRLLLKHNARVDLQDKKGLSALHYASLSGVFESVEMLVDAKAPINIQSKEGNTALHFAMYLVDPKITLYLLENGAFIDVQNKNGYSPLIIAAQEDNYSAIEVLIQHHANPDLKTKRGHTALSLAVLGNSDAIVFYLLPVMTSISTNAADEIQPVSLAYRYNHNVLDSILKYDDCKSRAHNFTTTFFELGFLLNQDDYLFRPQVSWVNYKFDISLSLGLSFRFFPKSIGYYNLADSYRERKESIIIGDIIVDKQFPLYTNGYYDLDVGIFGGFNYQYKRGTYTNHEADYQSRSYLIPRMGIYTVYLETRYRIEYCC